MRFLSPQGMIVAGGVLAAVFAVFHLFFWKLFRWKEELASLSSLNRAVVQILNLCLTFLFLAFAWLSFAFPGEMLATELGRALTVVIAAFWYLRAVEQIVFFGLLRPLSLVFFVSFVIGGTLYAAPLVLV